MNVGDFHATLWLLNFTAISSCFVRRSHTNFQPERISIAALFEELRQIPHERPKEKGRELEISSQFDAIFSTATRAFVCKVRLSIDKRGSFSLVPIGAPPFPNLTLLTYISMTKCLRRYRAVDTKTVPINSNLARPPPLPILLSPRATLRAFELFKKRRR